MLKKQKIIQGKRRRGYRGRESLVLINAGDKGLPDKNKKFTAQELRRYSSSTLHRILQEIYNYQPKEEPDFLPPDTNERIKKSKLIVLILKYQ